MQLNNLTAHAFHIDFKFHHIIFSAAFCHFFDFVEIILARFGFGRSCFGLATHPGQFFGEKILRFVNGRIFHGDSLFFFLQIIRVIAFVLVQFSIVKFNDFVTNALQEETVVRYHKQGDVFFGKITFEPFNHF